MLLSIEKVIEQLAYYVITLEDPEAAGQFIFNCLQGTEVDGPNDIASAQALFMEVTRLVSEIDAKYSLKCSKEYLKLVKIYHGTTDELEQLLREGEEYE